MVLLDLGLPDSSGCDTFIKAQAQSPQVPIIILSGFDDEALAVDAVGRGAQDYLVRGQEDSNLLTRTMQYAIKRKQAEKALWEAEEQFRTIVETAPSLLIISDAAGNNLYISPNCEEITGYTQEELRGKLIWWVHEDDTQRAKDIFERSFREGEGGKNLEYKLIKKNGEVRHVSSSWKPLKDGEGKFKGIVFQTIDINERKKAEETLRSAELEKKTILDSLVEHVIHEDTEMKILWANQAACESAGLTREELVGRYCYEVWPKRSEPCPDCPIVKAIKTKQPQEVEKSTPDGRVWFIRGYPERDEKGDIVGGIEVTLEITERKQAEDKLKASLKEKEVLLREIHHRVKNNLQVISSLLNMQARAAKDKNTIDILSESRNRINAMALIHSQLYEGGNLSEINMVGFMDKLVVQLLQIHSVPDRKITPVVHAVECSLPISIAIPVGLIANELLTNAFKHAFVNRKEGKIEVSLGASEKGVVNLTVSDDGIGLPEGFDINTSKTLGLHVVKTLAEDQLDGKLEVVRDKGATFKVEFEMGKE